MADWDTQPRDMPPSYWGQVVLEHNHSVIGYKQLTAYDAIVLASVVAYEDGFLYLPAWSMIQNFGAGINGGSSRTKPDYPSFAIFLQQYCQPINPLWAWDGDPSPSRAGHQLTGSLAPRSNGIPAPIGNMERFNGFMNGFRIVRRGGRPVRVPVTPPPAGIREVRRNRILAMMRIAAGGGAGQEEWSRIHASSRRVAYTVLSAQVGNPIPGFDGFAAYSAVHERFETISVADMSQSEAQAVIRRARPGRTTIRFAGRLLPGLDENGHERYSSNYFLFHERMSEGNVIYIRPSSGGPDSRRRPAPAFSDTGRRGLSGVLERVGDIVSGDEESSEIGTTETAEGGIGIVGGGSQEEEHWTIPSRQDLEGSLREWASRKELELAQQLGTGRRE